MSPFESDPDIFHHDFFDDIKNNRLPTFIMIEPRYQCSALPSVSRLPTATIRATACHGNSDSPINVSCGEQLLAKVFQALTANPSLFATTLMIVTYDEHGGVFNSVTPPPAASPFPGGTVVGFSYDTYGVRVPVFLLIHSLNQPSFDRHRKHH